MIYNIFEEKLIKSRKFGLYGGLKIDDFNDR